MSTGLPTASPPRVPDPPPAVRRRPRAWIALAIAGLFAIAVSISYALGTRSGTEPVETQASPSLASSPIDIASLDGVIVFGSTRNE